MNSLLIGLLHLSNVNFGKGEAAAMEASDASSRDSLAFASAILHVDPIKLQQGMCLRRIKAGTDWITSENTVEHALDVRNALVKQVYAALFNAVVGRINGALEKEGGAADGSARYGGGGAKIGVVDIFGFEIFPQNSIEQLCINFANEKLQRLFIGVLFEAAQARYTEEGLTVPQIDYADNKAVVALIGGGAGSLMAMLTEECVFPKGSDVLYLQKAARAHKEHPSFKEIKTSSTTFALRHFAGEVVYSVKGFLSKNKDPTSHDLLVLMQKSANPFIAALMKSDPSGAAPGAPRSPTKASARAAGPRFRSSKFLGVVDHFQASLRSLISTLQTGELHFIRCIKPNDERAPAKWNQKVVARQLNTSGIVSAVHVSRAGYADHLAPQQLLAQYGWLAGVEAKAYADAGPAAQMRAAVRLLETMAIPNDLYAAGRTRIFLRQGVLPELQRQRLAFFNERAAGVQALVRGYLHRRRVRKMREERARERERLRLVEEERRRVAAAKRRASEERAAAEEADRAKKEEEEMQRRREMQKARAQQAAAEKDKFEKAKQEREQARAAEVAAAATAAAAAAATAEAAAAAMASTAAPAATAATAEAASLAEAQKRKQMEQEERLLQRLRAEGVEVATPPPIATPTYLATAQSAADGDADLDEATLSTLSGETATEDSGDEQREIDLLMAADAEAVEAAARTTGRAGPRALDPSKYVCPIDDVLAYARYIGMDPDDDLELLWIADEALQATEPDGWEERQDPAGGSYFMNTITGMAMEQHPVDYHYHQIYLTMKHEKKAKMRQSRALSRGAVNAGAPSKLDRRSVSADGDDETMPSPAGWLRRSTNRGARHDGSASSRRRGTSKAESTHQDFSQLSVEVSIDEGERLGMELNAYNQILRIVAGSPMARAQPPVQVHDRIVAVDGEALGERLMSDVVGSEFAPRRLLVLERALPLKPARASGLGSLLTPRGRRASANKPPPIPPGSHAAKFDRFKVTLRRGDAGIGIVTDELNVVVDMVPGGPADMARRKGGPNGGPNLEIGDRIICVDGEELRIDDQIEDLMLPGADDGHVFLLERPKSAPQKKKGLKKLLTPRGAPAAAPVASKPPSRVLREVRMYKRDRNERLGIRFIRDDEGFDRQFWNSIDEEEVLKSHTAHYTVHLSPHMAHHPMFPRIWHTTPFSPMHHRFFVFQSDDQEEEMVNVQPIVSALDPEGAAAAAGVEIDDMVLSINGQTGLTNTQAASQLRELTGTVVLVLRRASWQGLNHGPNATGGGGGGASPNAALRDEETRLTLTPRREPLESM